MFSVCVLSSLQHCTLDLGSYVKDLAVVHDDLSSIVILDNSPGAYRSHPGIAIRRSTRLTLMHTHTHTYTDREREAQTLQNTGRTSCTLRGFNHTPLRTCTRTAADTTDTDTDRQIDR